jgi:predicted RNA binding protein YcfA (HicA-like mRNA interferase family)
MSSEVRFAELKKLLETAGYRLERIRGSHHVFTKAGASPVVVPVHRGKVKPYYARQIKKLVEGD